MKAQRRSFSYYYKDPTLYENSCICVQVLGVKHIIIDMEYTKEYKYWVYHRIMNNPKDKPFLLAHLKLLDEILKEITNCNL